MIDDDNDGAAWKPIFDWKTTPEELETIIDEQIKIAMVETLEKINAVPELSARQRIAALAQIAPIVRRRAAEELTKAWQHLQDEAAYGSSVH